MFFLLFFSLLFQNYIQVSIGSDPAELSEVNIIAVPSIRSLKEIENNVGAETNQLTNVNPLMRYLVSPNSVNVQSDDEMKKRLLPPTDFILFRTRRNASPTYKKGYPSSGGGGCCSSCGQCGGGCSGGGCGGGRSGSYSQSSSYSSSSSGSYNSYGKKK